MALLLLLTVCATATSQSGSSTARRDPAVIATIKGLEAQLAGAVVARDYATLRRIEAENYVYTDADAKVGTATSSSAPTRPGRAPSGSSGSTTWSLMSMMRWRLCEAC